MPQASLTPLFLCFLLQTTIAWTTWSATCHVWLPATAPWWETRGTPPALTTINCRVSIKRHNAHVTFVATSASRSSAYRRSSTITWGTTVVGYTGATFVRQFTSHCKRLRFTSNVGILENERSWSLANRLISTNAAWWQCSRCYIEELRQEPGRVDVNDKIRNLNVSVTCLIL